MPRKRAVTRTMDVTDVTVKVADKIQNSVYSVSLLLPQQFKELKQLEKACIKRLQENTALKFLEVEDSRNATVFCEMSEDYYLAHSVKTFLN